MAGLPAFPPFPGRVLFQERKFKQGVVEDTAGGSGRQGCLGLRLHQRAEAHPEPSAAAGSPPGFRVQEGQAASAGIFHDEPAAVSFADGSVSPLLLTSDTSPVYLHSGLGW